MNWINLEKDTLSAAIDYPGVSASCSHPIRSPGAGTGTMRTVRRFQ
jgi:hypothetical protein